MAYGRIETGITHRVPAAPPPRNPLTPNDLQQDA